MRDAGRRPVEAGPGFFRKGPLNRTAPRSLTRHTRCSWHFPLLLLQDLPAPLMVCFSSGPGVLCSLSLTQLHFSRACLSACNEGDLGSIPDLGSSHEEGKGYPPGYSGLENSIYCIVSPWGRKSQTRLSVFHSHFHCCLFLPNYKISQPCRGRSNCCFHTE